VSDQAATLSSPIPVPAKPAPAPAAARTKKILEGPVFTTLMKLSAPNVLNLLAFTGMVTFDGFFLGKLGSDALAGASLVFPWVMLVLQSTNNGMGTGVSSAVARAIGAGDGERANALVFHAFLLALALGAIFAALMLFGGPTLFRLMGGQDDMLGAALAYAYVALGGAAAICALNFMGNAVRGTGVERRLADDFEDFGGGSLLLQRLIAFAFEQRDLCFPAGSRGITTPNSFSRIGAL